MTIRRSLFKGTAFLASSFLILSLFFIPPTYPTPILKKGIYFKYDGFYIVDSIVGNVSSTDINESSAGNISIIYEVTDIDYYSASIKAKYILYPIELRGEPVELEFIYKISMTTGIAEYMGNRFMLLFLAEYILNQSVEDILFAGGNYQWRLKNNTIMSEGKFRFNHFLLNIQESLIGIYIASPASPIFEEITIGYSPDIGIAMTITGLLPELIHTGILLFIDVILASANHPLISKHPFNLLHFIYTYYEDFAYGEPTRKISFWFTILFITTVSIKIFEKMKSLRRIAPS